MSMPCFGKMTFGWNEYRNQFCLQTSAGSAQIFTVEMNFYALSNRKNNFWFCFNTENEMWLSRPSMILNGILCIILNDLYKLKKKKHNHISMYYTFACLQWATHILKHQFDIFFSDSIDEYCKYPLFERHARMNMYTHSFCVVYLWALKCFID